MNILRTAVLGCGGFGEHHARNLASLERISLVGFCDRNLDKAARLARTYGTGTAQVFTDPHDLFQQTRFDLLIIALPPFAHADEVKLCAERGIHYLIEKPIALNADLAWQMVADSEQAGIRTQVGFMYRFGAAATRLKALLDSGQAGQVGLIRAGYYCNSLHTHWWRSKEKAGGQVLEQAIHLLDLMRYLGGEVDSVFSLQRNLFHQDVPGYTVEDVSGTIASFKNGALGVLAATNAAVPGKWLWDFKLVSGGVTADFQDANHATLTHTREPGELPVETVASDGPDIYLQEVQDLLDAIDTGGPTRIPIREGALTLDLALAAVQSARTGQPVRL